MSESLRKTKFLIFLFLCFGKLYGSDVSFREESEVLEELLDGYDKLKLPSKRKYDPVNVSISLVIDQVAILSESPHTLMELDLYIRQTWEDHRLEYGISGNQPILKLPSRFADEIWKPDLSFENARTFKILSLGMDADGILMIWPEGKVVLGTRANLKTYCPLNLAWFPFDTQKCQVIIESYKYYNWKMDLFWDEGAAATYTNDLHTAEFSLLDLQSEKGVNNFSSGSYAELRLTIKMRRKAAHFVMMFHLPALMVAMAACVALCVPKDQLAARAVIGVVTIHAMLLLYCLSKSTTGYQNFLTLADIYLLFCLVFTLAVLATSLSHSLFRPCPKGNSGCDDGDSLDSSKMPKRCCSCEIVAAVGFPITFAIFLILYFLVTV